MNIICSNCGKLNHLQRDCKEPLTSYGLICFHKFINKSNDNKTNDNEINDNEINNNEEYKIIMIRRKSTIGYVEFLRGKYDINNIKYIIKLFNMMTKYEKETIKTVYNFDKLRTLLKMTKKNNVYKTEYDMAKKKFNYLKNNYILKNYFKNKSSKNLNKNKTIKKTNLIKQENKTITKLNNNDNIKINLLNFILENSMITWDETEWGLPKGRKNKNETNINCGIREFLEETSINRKNIDILINIKPIIETYTSINNITYRHVYYFAKYNNINNTEICLNPNDIEQSIEISSINWFNQKDASNIIRDYYTVKKNIINEGFKIINEIYNNYEII